MMIKKKSIMKFAVVAICLLAGLSSFQPGQPVFAANDTGQTGPYPTTIRSFIGYTVYCPQTLGANGFKHPVITWGNGTFSTSSLYSGLLRHLASYGFVVVCSNSTNTGTGTEIIRGIDLMERQNNTPSSFFYNKLNLDAVGACGHSQGGGGTINAAKDPRVVCSAPLMPMTVTPRNIQGPMFIITGSADLIINSALVKSTIYNPFNGTAVFGELQGATHLAPYGISPSTAILKYLTGWFELYLLNDSSYRSMFFGPGSVISTDRQWRVSIKEQVTRILEYGN